MSLLDATLLPHGQGTEVSVAASAVPVSFDGFGVKTGDNTKIFWHPL